MQVLPTIDLSLKNESRIELLENLLEALQSTGFFYLTGLSGYDSDELLYLTKWFFNLPEEVKLSMTKKMFNKEAVHYYRGYFPVQPNEISHKEGFEIGPSLRSNLEGKPESKERTILEETNQWPRTENTKEDQRFEERMNYYYKIFTEAGIELIRLLSESWNLENKDVLTAYFSPNHLSTFRLLHYPPREGTPPEEAVDRNYVLQCSEHKDSGFFTLLSTFDYEGLQIRTSDDEWIDVPNVKDCLVVNIGELLATISGGMLKATNHRVIDKGVDRYSCPFFLEPNFDANVNIRLPPLNKIGANSRDQHSKIRSQSDDIKDNNDDVIYDSNDVIKYGFWVINRMKQFAEFRDLV